MRRLVTMVGNRACGPRGVVRALVAILAIAGSAGMLVGCSAAFDPSYPAIHDMPAPRAEAPMNDAELKRATSDLVTQRTTLGAEAQAAAQATAQANAQAAADAAAAAAITGSTPPAANGPQPAAPAAKP